MMEYVPGILGTQPGRLGTIQEEELRNSSQRRHVSLEVRDSQEKKWKDGQRGYQG